MNDGLSHIDRRAFLRSSLAVSSAALVGASMEEKALLAAADQQRVGGPTTAPATVAPMPTGRIGNLVISRLICGGNLISGFAHSRDLIYVSRLLKQYFTDDKVLDTLALCESLGVNTAILRLDGNTIRLLTKYRQERGGKIQWIAQVHFSEKDFDDIRRAVDNGAVGVYTHGGVGDFQVKSKRVDVLGKALDVIRQHKGVIAGIAGHLIEVPMACEQAGLNPDFYMKTFHSRKYWSAEHPTKHDNLWDEDPERTREFMQTVKRPWIAYKVLAAGAIHPKDGFAWAYRNGADFMCVGMFDFQVAEDVRLAIEAVAAAQNRARPWCA